MSADKRSAPRARAGLRVSIETEGETAEGTIRDISSCGALVEDCPLKLELGAEVTLRPLLRRDGDSGVEPRSPLLWIRAEVTRVAASDAFGVAFQELDEATADLLSRLAATSRSADGVSEP